MAEGTRRVDAEGVTGETWAPFGWIPLPDTDPDDGAHRLEFEWGDPHVNVISHAPDEVVREGDGLVCDRMYRHDTHTQVLMTLNGPSVIAVAPADTDLSTPAGLAAVRAFRLETQDAVVLHRGTWHWGPFPLGADPVLLFNVQGLGYVRDNASADLGGLGEKLLVVAGD
ncbi:MAG TPA: ureidoglycolate lyase [Acidimicrobiales bacterium]|nr:ureidoglycolate lyase [Acidimicrobiales bacterium]